MDPSSLAAIVAGAVVAAVLATFKVVTMFRRNGREDRRLEAGADVATIGKILAELASLRIRVDPLEEFRGEIREIRARLEGLAGQLTLIQWRLDHPGVNP